MLEDRCVVSPGGLRQVHDLVPGEPLAEEGGPDPEGAGAGDALDGHVAAGRHVVVAWGH